MPTVAGEDEDYINGVVTKFVGLTPNTANIYRNALRTIAALLPATAGNRTLEQLLTDTEDARYDQTLAAIRANSAITPTVKGHITQAANAARWANMEPDLAGRLKTDLARIKRLLAETPLPDGTREKYKISLNATARGLLKIRNAPTLEDMFARPLAFKSQWALKQLKERHFPQTSRSLYLHTALAAIHQRHYANHGSQSQLPSTTLLDEMTLCSITDLLDSIPDEERRVCETVLTALANWMGQNPDLPTFSRFIAVTVQGQEDPLLKYGLEEEEPLLYGGPAKDDWILLMCKSHLEKTNQTLAADHIFGVFDYLRGHSDRTSEIKATFDLGGGTYYRAWIDAVLPK
ncbi:hypothetical protein C6558_38575, partial [Ensifer sp. NM-2]